MLYVQMARIYSKSVRMNKILVIVTFLGQPNKTQNTPVNNQMAIYRGITFVCSVKSRIACYERRDFTGKITTYVYVQLLISSYA